VIATNPPYVKTGDLMSLQPEVRDFEPGMALIAGPDGTESAEKIILQAPDYLRKRGPLVMEIGIGQTEALKKIIQGTGQYGPIEVLKDLAGIERVLMVRRK
jgi:release factor glutamine methyltransferase